MKNRKTEATATELIPADGRRSFYGKAKALRADDGWTYLLSYDTVMCRARDGKVERLSGYESATTARHLRSFLRSFGPGKMTTKEFYGLPLKDGPVVLVKTA